MDCGAGLMGEVHARLHVTDASGGIEA